MVGVIARYHSGIFCEIYKGKHSNQQPDETVKFVIGEGCRALVVREGRLVEYEKHNDTLYNYLFSPRAL